MSEQQVGRGTVWLAADRLRGEYRCEWYGGAENDVLWERARSGSARSAVAWGLRRTPRVQILTDAGQTLWAGTAPRPDEIDSAWVDEGEVVGRGL